MSINTAKYLSAYVLVSGSTNDKLKFWDLREDAKRPNKVMTEYVIHIYIIYSNIDVYLWTNRKMLSEQCINIKWAGTPHTTQLTASPRLSLKSGLSVCVLCVSEWM